MIELYIDLGQKEFMAGYRIPRIEIPEPIGANTAILVASGDLRLSANRTCWAAQKAMEVKVIKAFANEGITLIRGHEYDPQLGHGFIWNQRIGMDVFKGIHPEAKIIVAEAVWQYSHHVLAGLRDHRGPILTLANWSGEWPGLVGMLNLNASLTKMGVKFSTIWSIDFTDNFFLNGIHQWIDEGRITHDTSHVLDYDQRRLPSVESELGISLAKELMQSKAIMGIFDEGCMGMYNAIIDDEQLNKLGVYKERLSQSGLFVAMREVTDKEAQNVRGWLEERGMTFVTGTDEETELTDQ